MVYGKHKVVEAESYVGALAENGAPQIGHFRAPHGAAWRCRYTNILKGFTETNKQNDKNK